MNGKMLKTNGLVIGDLSLDLVLDGYTVVCDLIRYWI